MRVKETTIVRDYETTDATLAPDRRATSWRGRYGKRSRALELRLHYVASAGFSGAQVAASKQDFDAVLISRKRAITVLQDATPAVQICFGYRIRPNSDQLKICSISSERIHRLKIRDACICVHDYTETVPHRRASEAPPARTSDTSSVQNPMCRDFCCLAGLGEV